MHAPLIITQTLSVDANRAFEMFSTKAHLLNWWGPKGMEMEIKSFDFRPGGIFHYVLKGGNGFEMWGKFSYLEIDAPNRIVLLNAFSNANGETVKAPEVPFGADWPLEMWTEYTFASDGEGCQLKLTSYPHQGSEASQELFFQNHDKMKQGFKGTFDKLAAYLAELES